MKIVLIGTAYPYRGGLAAYNERLAREFLSEGFEVRIMTFTLQYPSFLFPGKSQFLDAPSPQGLKIERIVNSVNPFNWISVGSALKKEKPDIIIFKYWLPFMAPCFGTIARIARSNKHTRIICILDNVIPHEPGPGDKLLTRYFTGSIDGAVAMSDSVLTDLRKFNVQVPAKLNPHPLFDNFGQALAKDEALKKLGIGVSGNIILFFGFIRAYKGLDLLIEAFSDQRFRDLNVRLIIAGEFYEDSKPYRELIVKYNLGDYIFLFDRFINDEEVAAYFSAADIVVQPYKSATQSGVTQIAYHFENPMLVTDVGGLKEIVPDGKCGYVVKPDPAAIAGALTDFFQNSRKDTFVKNIKTEKLRFSWGRMTAAINEVFNKSLNNDSQK